MDNLDTTYNRRDLWITRLYYFMLVGGGGFLNPFINLFYVRQGLNGSQIGWLVAIGSVMALIAAPLWTEYSARSSRPRLLLSVSLGMAALGAFWLSQQAVFLWFAVVAVFRSLVGSGISPISDALAVRVTGSTRSGYGSVRVWGSIGWAIIVLTGGFLTQRFGLITAFQGYIVTLVVCMLLVNLLANPGKPAAKALSPRLYSGLGQVARSIFSSPALMGLAGMMILSGIANNGVQQFENVFLDQLHASEGLIGVASMVGSVVEVPGMLWADRLVRRHGTNRMLVVYCMMAVLIRGFIFFFPSVPTIIAARAFWGLGFSFYTVALVRYVVERSAPEQTGTALAIFTVTLSSLIGIIATPLSGYIFDLVGARWLYLIAVGGYALSLLILRWARSKEQQEEEQIQPALEPEASKIG